MDPAKGERVPEWCQFTPRIDPLQKGANSHDAVDFPGNRTGRVEDHEGKDGNLLMGADKGGMADDGAVYGIEAGPTAKEEFGTGRGKCQVNIPRGFQCGNPRWTAPMRGCSGRRTCRWPRPSLGRVFRP